MTVFIACLLVALLIVFVRVMLIMEQINGNARECFKTLVMIAGRLRVVDGVIRPTLEATPQEAAQAYALTQNRQLTPKEMRMQGRQLRQGR